ncbi:sulfotransferase domain-containing protein [Defluviimonas sp. WL0002]|uniref:Sulfotransferase domain-containing protein n=1 Tax=Albidovulum marisflavi TaxID=2984159 RepID=A0ABT2ZA14_9RHOB|nr:sulfotransferase domain-containing protein [Defluviimonas sp. WL0002]MCV2867877.1 sulfotransferase domain-containing protein [Defluviimonas sp. WL0002]
MATELPIRSDVYDGPLTTSSIWEKFSLRAGDVIVSTPPKSGTTWTQIIVTSLIAGRPLSPREMGEVSPWLDCALHDPEESKALLDAQDIRRCIKSHTPLSGIAYDPRCAYIAVYRHPLDVHFSMRHHAAHMESDVMRVRYPGDVRLALRMFLDDELYGGSCDALDLHSIAYHYASFKKWERLGNIHFFHYADMVADLPSAVRRMARILGMDAPASLLDEITQGTTFANLKKMAAASDQRATGEPDFYLSANFFNSGASNKWEGQLSSTDLAEFEKRIRQLLPEKDAAWLLWGSRATPGLAEGTPS